MIVSSLINNITLIVSLSILYSLIIRKWDYESGTNRITSGFLFGAVAIVGMMNPLVFSPGLIFDGRSIIISIAGLFGGWITALISALMSIAYRVWLGGPGAIMGVSVITCSALIGIGYHHVRLRHPHLVKPLHLLGFGIVVHLCMLLLTMTLPSGMKFEVLTKIAMPVITIYPLGTLLVCLVLLDQESRVRAEISLRDSEEKYRLVVENARESIIITQAGKIVFLNGITMEMIGFSEEELTAMPFTDLVHPDDRQMVLENHMKRIRGDDLPSVYSFRIVRKDESIKWVEINSTMIRWKGQPSILSFLNDITARRESEVAKRETEILFKAFMENLPGLVLIKDDELRPIYANRVFRKHFPADSWMGKEPLETFTPDIAQPMIDNDLRAIREGYICYEEKWTDNDGVEHIFETHKFHIARQDKTPFLGAIIMDITERRRAEEALRESEEKYRILLDESTDPIFSFSSEGSYLYANRAFAQGVGKELNQIINRKIWDVFPREEADKRFAALSHVFQTGEEKVIEIRVPRPGGDSFYITTITPIKDDSGKVSTAICSSKEITDRKQTEDALRRSEERFRAIFNSTFQFTGLLMPDGTVIEFNQAALDFAGITMQDVRNRPLWEARWWWGDETRVQQLKEAIKRAAGGEFIRYEAELRGAGETKAVIDFSLKPVYGKSGEITLLIPEGRDITEIRRAEEERKEFSERLQRAEKMEVLGRLSGGVAHDLNNVLGVLVGYSELLQEKLPDDSPLKRYANNIHESGVRGAAIIQDLLTLARRGVTVSEVVDLNQLVLNYFKTLEFEKLRSDHPGVKVISDLARGLLYIKGSPVHLGKTLMNLLFNAVESISGLGEVMIRTENRYLDRPIMGYDDMQEGDYVVLTVSDTGSGIPAKDIGKIFEPFYTKKVMGKSGTGLGLSIVWGVVKDHNGYIDVQSREGDGAAFSLYFPVTREKPEKDENAVSLDTYKGRGETILVVDDVPAQRELAAAILERLGYKIEIVPSGEDAIDFLERKQVDLVILDMIMDPGMDGLDTYKKIIESNPGQRAVIVSGFAETERVIKAQEMGAGPFVKKPYIMEKIGVAVRQELDRNNK
jgi:two-component system, cell cycle sensor histidine kinase and response regulator CckA